MEKVEDDSTTSEEVVLTEVEDSETKSDLVGFRDESTDDVNSPFKIKWKFFKKLYSYFFILNSDPFNWSGDYPKFEESVLFDKCKSFTFSFSRLFWERVFNDTRPLHSSIRAKSWWHRKKEIWW
ncbi:hypothetical protein [Mycoplasma ovis]|uniref:hypothetical protein n=1 Tax=Mycoplasma ovis TaxID=171632 RepID=UPI001F46ACAC|nr:hypothetical protein [Mycoplasma ovis]